MVIYLIIILEIVTNNNQESVLIIVLLEDVMKMEMVELNVYGVLPLIIWVQEYVTRKMNLILQVFMDQLIVMHGTTMEKSVLNKEITVIGEDVIQVSSMIGKPEIVFLLKL